ncbi:DoxX family protein [Nocardia sp. NPDC059239]|uniref:DoxX family protein n=1 Tax=unclassified Nocardia TaxID=2637762 RepID=UPI0036A714CB
MATITQQIPTRTIPAAQGRIRTYAYWACTVSLAFMMVSGAYGEYTQQYGTQETHTILGYPTYFLTLIATWKLLGSAAILVPGFPRLKEWAYAGMFFNMTGAFISHLVERDYGAAGMHLTVTAGIVALVLASWALRPADRVLPRR